MPSKSLRQRVIARIKREGIDMRFWTPADAKDRGKFSTPTACGTSCCLAGNIGLETGLVDETTPAWKVSEREITAAWAKHYGRAEAGRLNFYLRPPTGGDMADTKPEHVIAHLLEIRTRKPKPRAKKALQTA